MDGYANKIMDIPTQSDENSSNMLDKINITNTGRWTEEEKNKFTVALTRLGANNMEEIAKEVGTRTRT